MRASGTYSARFYNLATICWQQEQSAQALGHLLAGFLREPAVVEGWRGCRWAIRLGGAGNTGKSSARFGRLRYGDSLSPSARKHWCADARAEGRRCPANPEVGCWRGGWRSHEKVTRMPSEHLDRVYAAQSPEELRQVYEEWAAQYDRELVEGMGWDKPTRVGEVLLPFLPEQPEILDVAAGTGLMGQFLHDHGYRHLEAVDFSAQMLRAAEKRGVYRHLHQLDLLQPLLLPQFDVVTAVGIFTEGHLGAEGLEPLGRLVKAGGLLALSLRDDLLPNYQAELDKFQLVAHQQFSDGLEARPWSARVYRL